MCVVRNSRANLYCCIYFTPDSLGSIWTGLIIADENDACSYRWPYSCAVPDWVIFKDGPISGRCGAIDTELNHKMLACDEVFQFVCEHDTGGRFEKNNKSNNNF